jgi:hypothetical protein
MNIKILKEYKRVSRYQTGITTERTAPTIAKIVTTPTNTIIT